MGGFENIGTLKCLASLGASIALWNTAIAEAATIRTETILISSTSIEVCFEDIDSTLGALKIESEAERSALKAEAERFQKVLKSLIYEQFNRRTEIRFFGFDTCPQIKNGFALSNYYPIDFGGKILRTAFNGIRVMVLPVKGFASAAARGEFIKGTYGGISLSTRLDYCGKGGELKCFKSLALHEFGHALGFDHEDDRKEFNGCPNAPELAAKKPFASYSGMAEEMAFDSQSVMSYCADHQRRFGDLPSVLSSGDVDSINRYYRDGPPFAPQGNVEAMEKCFQSKGIWRAAASGIPGKCIATELESK